MHKKNYDFVVARSNRPPVFKYELFKDTHHLTPISLFSQDATTINIWRWKHNAWHRMFGNRSLSEVIHTLIYSPKSWITNGNIYSTKGIDWCLLFGYVERQEAIAILLRLKRIKYGKHRKDL